MQFLFYRTAQVRYCLCFVYICAELSWRLVCSELPLSFLFQRTLSQLDMCPWLSCWDRKFSKKKTDNLLIQILLRNSLTHDLDQIFSFAMGHSARSNVSSLWYWPSAVQSCKALVAKRTALRLEIPAAVNN